MVEEFDGGGDWWAICENVPQKLNEWKFEVSSHCLHYRGTGDCMEYHYRSRNP